MKTALFLLFLLVSSGICGIPRPSIMPLKQPQLKVAEPDIDLCPTCIQFSSEVLNELLDIILNAGVIGGCNELCQLLHEKVPSEIVEVVCNLLCDYVGVKTFINFIEQADLDPIYYCELLKLCPIKDDGDAHILSLLIKPKDVEYGSRFTIEMLFSTKNGTGTGEIDLEIDTQDGIPLGEDELSEPLAPGAYNVTWTVHAKPDPNCDPTQQPCEMWLTGNYTAHVAVCNGECGSEHPHSKIYDETKATFNVVKK